MTDKELIYKIAITHIPMVGAVTAKNLISYCGGAEAVFRSQKRELLKIPGIGATTASNILKQDVLTRAEQEIAFIEKNAIQPIFYLDKNYPQRLRNCNDSPIMLYYKGNADLNAERVVAIVGTRMPSPYGKTTCEEILTELQPYKPLIVSGLAYGIDIIAHKKSLELNMPNIGVLGSGLNRIYPQDHRPTAQQMIHCGGILSEYISDTPPDREHFPMRNRIIAGMCDALIVVESADGGGSIISAKVANDYNRDVFAVPGRLKDKFSAGCNWLIRTNQATIFSSAAHLAQAMNWTLSGEKPTVQRELFVEINDQENKIIQILRQAEHVSIDKLTFATNFSPSEMAAHLLNLEFKGVVKSLPGKLYAMV